jgi:hypothetical protein
MRQMVQRTIESLAQAALPGKRGMTGAGMTEFFIVMYALLAMFVLGAVQQNERMQRPTPQMVTMVGWGLFSLSSTLALLFGAVGLALALGMQIPLGSFEAML